MYGELDSLVGGYKSFGICQVNCLARNKVCMGARFRKEFLRCHTRYRLGNFGLGSGALDMLFAFAHVSHGGGGQWGEAFLNSGRSKAWERGKVPSVNCFAPSVDRRAPACLVEVLYELWYGAH